MKPPLEGKERSRGEARLSYPTDEELCYAIREFRNEMRIVKGNERCQRERVVRQGVG